MADTTKDREKLREIVQLLPGKNCGKCGHENCGKFAVALVEGQAQPTDCRKNISNVKEICAILGIEPPSEQELQTLQQKHHHGHGPHGHGDRPHGHHGHGKHR